MMAFFLITLHAPDCSSLPAAAAPPPPSCDVLANAFRVYLIFLYFASNRGFVWQFVNPFVGIKLQNGKEQLLIVSVGLAE